MSGLGEGSVETASLIAYGAAAFAVPFAVTGIGAYALAALTRLRGLAVALTCGVVAPVCVCLFAWLSSVTKPDPSSIDGPAYILVTLVCWALLLIPTCLIASSLGVWLRRRVRDRRAPIPSI